MLTCMDMRIVVSALRMLVRLLGVLLIALGILFWSGNALTMTPLHMLAGILLVLSLWTLSVLAARSGEHPGLVGLAVVWGLIVPILGLTQAGLLPGPLHWIIRVLHLLVGLAAISLSEVLARRTLPRLHSLRTRSA